MACAHDLIKGSVCDADADMPDRTDDAILEAGAEPIISPRWHRRWLHSYDKALYQKRNLIERFFNKLNQFRRVATRYEKTARNYLAVVTLAATILWLR